MYGWCNLEKIVLVYLLFRIEKHSTRKCAFVYEKLKKREREKNRNI